MLRKNNRKNWKTKAPYLKCRVFLISILFVIQIVDSITGPSPIMYPLLCSLPVFGFVVCQKFQHFLWNPVSNEWLLSSNRKSVWTARSHLTENVILICFLVILLRKETLFRREQYKKIVYCHALSTIIVQRLSRTESLIFLSVISRILIRIILPYNWGKRMQKLLQTKKYFVQDYWYIRRAV